jgi:hypothetical protein
MMNGVSAVSSPGPTASAYLNSARQAQGSWQPSSVSIEDTVQLSSAALTALKAKPTEAMETPEQTQAEAATGDPQALAKLAAKHLR